MIRIGIVANEPSGDLLGAGLMRSLRDQLPEVCFEGVGGPRMEQQGLASLYPLERLSVMGLIEVVKHLPDLLRIRRDLARRFLADPPDLFIGVDAPDFNLGLEKRLKQAGIPTVHYVCPTVWAWRPKRVKKIRAAADRVLCILPFEPDFLARHGVDGAFVGHPLADDIPLQVDGSAARERLGLAPGDRVLALLPGSRVGEVSLLAEPFLQTAVLCRRRFPDLKVVVPLINSRVRGLFEQTLQTLGMADAVLRVEGDARDVLAAAEVVLTASGTATLEALLLRRPMVVGYRLNPLTYRIVKGLDLVKVPHVAIANLLADRRIVPEFIQEAVRPEALAEPLCRWLESPVEADPIRAEAERIHRMMRRDADRAAADAVSQLICRSEPAGVQPQKLK